MNKVSIAIMCKKEHGTHCHYVQKEKDGTTAAINQKVYTKKAERNILLRIKCIGAQRTMPQRKIQYICFQIIKTF